MTTTAKQIIQAAVARRTANDPDKLFSKPELIGVLSSRLQTIYSDMADSYPLYFAKSERVDPTDLGWLHPVDMVFVFRVETYDVPSHLVYAMTDADADPLMTLCGFDPAELDPPPHTLANAMAFLEEPTPPTQEEFIAAIISDFSLTLQQCVDALPGLYYSVDVPAQECVIVPLLDKHAEEGVPRIYQLNRYFHTVGESGDPVEEFESTGGQPLNFFGPLRHPPLDTTAAWDAPANTLDLTWPEHRNDLLIAHLALYLAIKDGRGADEVGALQQEVDRLTQLLQREAEVGHEFKRARRWTDRPMA